MKFSDFQHPIQSAYLITHRRVRPFLWNAVIAKQAANLTDGEFLRRCRWPADAAQALRQFHERSRFRFFFHPRNRKDFFLNTLTSLQSEERIITDADATLANRFQTLGSPLVELGTPIPWQRDFKSGKEWPAGFIPETEILDLGHPSDVKVPWELSRFHQAWWLGKAYWLTGREQYAEKFRSLVDEWIAANPPGHGTNWVVAMEAAIRAANWIAGYSFFCQSRSCDDAFWMRMMKSLYAHGLAISYNLECSRNNGNHFLSDVVGLVYLGTFFADTPFGRRWFAWGTKAIERELTSQVHADGVDFEKSTAYHRLVLELFASAAMLCRLNKRSLSENAMRRLELMYEFVLAYTRPDGSIPLWGDADDGRLFRFTMDEDVNDHRHALSTGAVLFERGDFAHAAGGFHQETLWYFGGEGFERFRMLRDAASAGSRAFTEGGCYVMRDARSHIFIDAGDLGQRGRGGHGHNDTLSFTFWHEGAEVIVDPGTYCYTSDVPARQEFRSVGSHNTVRVDGAEIAEFDGLWQVKKDGTNTRVLACECTAAKELLEAEHFGYTRLPGRVVHRRRFEFSKEAVRLSLQDVLSGDGTHRLEWFLQLHPDAAIETCREAMVEMNVTGKRFRISSSEGTWRVDDSWYSRSYGVRVRSKKLTLTLDRALPVTLGTVIERI